MNNETKQVLTAQLNEQYQLSIKAGAEMAQAKAEQETATSKYTAAWIAAEAARQSMQTLRHLLCIKEGSIENNQQQTTK